MNSDNSQSPTELLSHVLYKNEEGKNMNTSLSFLLFLNAVNSANLVRKSLMTTKTWQLLRAVLLYNKKKNYKVFKDMETWMEFSFPSGDSVTGCSGWSAR